MNTSNKQYLIAIAIKLPIDSTDYKRLINIASLLPDEDEIPDIPKPTIGNLDPKPEKLELVYPSNCPYRSDMLTEDHYGEVQPACMYWDKIGDTKL